MPIRVRVSRERVHAWHVNTQGTHRTNDAATLVHE